MSDITLQRETLIEAVARVIYDQWTGISGYVPWVERGNSLRQDEARGLARNAVESAAAEAQPSEVEAQAVELAEVGKAIDEGGGFWASCSGCYETDEGYPPKGSYFSPTFRCYLGNGCSECGGLGAIWDDTDYEAMAKAMSAPTQAQVEPMAFDGYLCQAWGETDLPCAQVVRDLAGVRAFMISQWLGEEGASDDWGKQYLPDIMEELEGRDWKGDGKWSTEFEIGGISVDYVYSMGTPPAQPAQAAAPVDGVALRGKIEHALKLADAVGQSRGMNNLAQNTAAVNRLVDLEREIYATLSAHPAQAVAPVDGVALRSVEVSAMEQAIDDYLEDYEMRGEDEDGRDACYSPTEGEKALIKDAIFGLMEDDAWKAASLSAPPTAEAVRLSDAEIREWMETIGDYNIAGYKLQGLDQIRRFALAIESASIAKQVRG